MNVPWSFGAVWRDATNGGTDDDPDDFDPSLPCKWIPEHLDDDDDGDGLMVSPRDASPPPVTPAGLFVGLTLTGHDGEVLETTGLLIGESVRRVASHVAELFFWTALCVLLGVVVFALVARLPDSAFDRLFGVSRRRRVVEEEEEEEEEGEVRTPETTPGRIAQTMAAVHGGKPSSGQLLHYFKPATVAAALARRDGQERERKQAHPARVAVGAPPPPPLVGDEEVTAAVAPAAEPEVGDKRGAPEVAAGEEGEERERVAKAARCGEGEGEGEGGMCVDGI